jgi:tRNA (mo5U34)-methyltransferase
MLSLEGFFDRLQRPLPFELGQRIRARREEFEQDPRWQAFASWREKVDVERSLSVTNDGVVVAGAEIEDRDGLTNALRGFMPWRKGPFRIGGVDIDAEWQSQMKWDRLRPFMGDLAGKSICDIGSGNGYYTMRACTEGIRHAVAVDPTMIYVMQCHALASFMPELPLAMEPLGFEDCEYLPATFDQVWLFGILYHHADPVSVLRGAAQLLRRGGRLLVETIVVEGPPGWALVPERLYAGAKSFWYLPTMAALVEWGRRADLDVVEASEPEYTTVDEQRLTEWRTGGESLGEGLDNADPRLTIEGYPAPQRVILSLKRRG